MPSAAQLRVRQRAVDGTLRSQIHVGEMNRRQPRVDAQQSRHLLGKFEPRRDARVHAVVQTGRRGQLQQLTRRSRHIRHIRWGDRPIDEHPGGTVGPQAVENPGSAALGRTGSRRRTEHTFDPQHVRARCVEREPFAEQLRRGIHALRIRANPFRYTGRRPSRRTRNRCCSAPAWHRAPTPPAPAPGRRRHCCSTPRSGDPRRRRQS